MSQIITTALTAFQAKQKAGQRGPFEFPGLVFTGELVIGVEVFWPPQGQARALMTEVEHVVGSNGDIDMDSRGWKILCFFIYRSLVRQLLQHDYSRPNVQEKNIMSSVSLCNRAYLS